MSGILPGLGLLVLAVAMLWALMAAPIGTRTFRVQARIRAPKAKLWQALHPFGDFANWYGAYVAVERIDDAHGRVQINWDGRDGKPIEREFELSDVVDGERFTMRTTEDNSLAMSFWEHHAHSVALAGADGDVTVTLSETDRYRGAAFFLFRYFAMRRQASKLRQWAETGTVTRGGVFEHPLTQFAMAGLSALILWPFFGLTREGFLLSVALTIVVGLHELGHMVAFRIMGHRSTRMIFIPVLGGLALGGRPYNTHFEVAFSAIMGAGMSVFIASLAFAASFLLQATGYREAAQAAAVFALICALFNLGNLVPVWKFDGGQALRQIMRGRLTQALASFAALAAFMGVGLAAGASLQAMLIAGAVFAVLSVMTAGSGVKPRTPLKPATAAEKGAIAAAFAATFAAHACVLIWSVGQVL